MAKIYKQGSRGEEVRRIQQMLAKVGYSLKADGDYGQRTADAVRQFQQKQGLKPVDGIVGPVTMARLTSAAIAASQPGDPSGSGSLHITKNPIQTHITFCIWRPIRYIAIHYTAGGSSRGGMAQQTRNVFLKRTASADFVVDDNQVVQVNPDLRNYYCWSVGDKKNPYSGGGRLYGVATNKNTISIEVCSNLKGGFSADYANHEGWYFTKASLNNALKLIRYLMKEYGVPKSNVVRHYDVSGKLCPGVVGWNDAMLYTADGKQTRERNNSREWEMFLASL